ncbi:HDOD domain-containing protein, partial [bacterium]|nr:HDOD domain-containing protein [bacterium]
VLAGKLLRVANTPMFRPRQPYTSLEQAIVRLGTKTVQELVAGIATMGLFADVGGIGERIRDHSAGVAAIARVLGTEWRFRGVGRAFLAGLMHDLGKLLILQTGELDYSTLSPAQLETPDEVHLCERVTLGFDHAVLGAHVLSLWNLPPDLTRIVAWHHQPGRAYEAGG